MKTDIYYKDFALKLALKKRPRETRNWPIEVSRGIGAIQ